ncbi:hypothetical protein HC251_04515 [Iamia sp. SCSIO 61187]|uniref:hypothetical protein n=1 Tax=Iamia sp. SCSIO 61187 TaxID=2722752 RepID=UPI001C62A483|nr:hypothetical protein [Iamia sp. SCSIO 61187]QYG91773.1 hypothetical protein HC251_04515 [Iamia sp. SCSIO 61187]
MCDEIVNGWLVDNVPHEIAIEEIHSGSEIVLRHVLGAGQSVNWATLMERAESRQVVGPEDLAALRALNVERRTVKHRGGAIDEARDGEIRKIILAAIGVLDGLLSDLDVRATQEGTASSG